MKLGVYRNPAFASDSDAYERLALYDFEAEAWAETSEGTVVSKASGDPTPEELKVRFDADPDARATVVRTPERMAAENRRVVVREPELSVEEGHERREERGGPLLTQTEAQYRRDRGVVVFPDDYDLDADGERFYEEEGKTVVRESEWDGLNFAETFDFEFPTEARSRDSRTDGN